MTDTYQPLAPQAIPPPPTPQDRAIAGVEGAQASQANTFAQQQSALAPRYDALSKTLAAPIPQAPTPQKVADAPKPEDFQKYSMAFAGAMAVLGAVAGRFTRMSGQASLAAFTGALNGWQAGNLQAYEQSAKQWEQNTKKTLENNATELASYKTILENRRLNIDQQMSQIQMISAQYHDKMMFDAASAKNYTMVAQLYQAKDQAADKAKQAAAVLAEKRREQTQKIESTAAYWMSPEGVQRRQTLTPEQNTAIDQMIHLYGAGKPGAQTPEKIALQKFLEENPNATAAQIQEFRNKGKQPRSAQGMSLAKYLEENPNATSEDIQRFQAQQAGNVAYQRTAGSQGARVEVASNEVEQLLPQAIETSRALPRGKIVPLNTLIQKWQQGTSDPAYNDFILANFSLINAYTRAMNPQGVPRIAERLEQKAIGILSTATSPQAYETQARRLWMEVQASKKAVAKTAEGRTEGDVNAPVPWQAQGGAVKVKTPAEAEKLDPGTRYVTPDGQEFTR